MSSLIRTPSQDLGERDLNGSPTPRDGGSPSALGASARCDAFGAKKSAPGGCAQDVLGNENGTNLNETTSYNQSVAAPVSSLRGDESEDEPGAFDDSHLQVDQPKKKKKKRSKRPKSKRGLNAPTGFEQYSADAPITPAEYDEERKLFDLDLPFTDRIVTAIHRYERRRKMDPTTRDIFYKYLAYGGLDVSPNMFQGISKGDAESMDKESLTRATAQTSLPHEFRDIGKESTDWVVDFEEVMRGFLSRRLPSLYPLDTEAEVKTAITLLTNFMNYLLHHDVCPEYREQILRAKQCCMHATHEVWAMRQVRKWLPGDFNIACSTLFQGAYSEIYDGQTSWADDPEAFVGQSDDQARQIVKFAVACAGSEEQYLLWYEKAMANEIKVTNVSKEIGLEIAEIVLPDDETRNFYKERTKDFRPVGKIYTKKWKNPSAPPDDLTPEEQALRKQAFSPKNLTTTLARQDREAEVDEYEFFIEEAILQHLVVGMKLEGTVRTLNCGIYFIDEVFDIYLSFDTFLPNERLDGYKKPRFWRGFSMGEDGLLRYDPEKGENGEIDDGDAEEKS